MSSKSIIPRGFSRFYVLSLLSESTMTGKQIMEETEKRTNGTWRPSPGLVYPLLGKLLSQGLVSEVEGGGYVITEAGKQALSSYQSSQHFEATLSSFLRIGLFGKYLAQDISDKVVSVIQMAKEDLSKISSEQRAKYRAFLVSELNRLDRSAPAPAESGTVNKT